MVYANFRKYFVWLIIASAVIRMWVASSVELGNDEVYYWTYSQHLEWNYFDHPPMVALWVRLFTANLWLQGYELFIRLGSIVGCALCTWFMYKIGTAVQSERAGWIAACLYNASLYAGIIAGVFIMPDSPQMVFWCWCLYLIVKIAANNARWLPWLLFGVSAGLCIMSKVHGVFLWVGLLLFILLRKRALLKQPQLYVSLLITAVIASPILIWNIHNHFISYQYHSNRVVVNNLAINSTSFFRELFGQVLYNNPVVVVLSFLALKYNFQQRKHRSEALSVFLWIALPLIVLLLLISLFRDTLPHWSGPGYVALLPVAAVYIDTRWQQAVPKCINWSLALVLFTIVLGISVIKSYPGTLGSRVPQRLGTGDFTLDMHGWKNAGAVFRQLYRDDVRRGVVKAGTPVVCYKWFPAAHEEYYFCRSAGIPMVGLGAPFDLHQYAWRNQSLQFDQAYCIVPSDENYNVREKYAAYFHTIDSVTEIKSYRSDKPACCFYVYRLQGFRRK